MPGLYRGTTPITKLYRGTTPIHKVYRGSTVVFDDYVAPPEPEPGRPRHIYDDFNRPDALTLNSTANNWVNGAMPWGPANQIGVSAYTARISQADLPWGTGLNPYYRYSRWKDPLVYSDAEVEFKLATQGSGRVNYTETGTEKFETVIYLRATADFVDGLGIAAANGSLYFMTKRGGTLTPGPNTASFQANDTIKITSGGGYLQLYRNGSPQFYMSDAGYPNDANHRYVMMGMAVAKDKFGSRRFSPQIDYIDAKG